MSVLTIAILAVHVFASLALILFVLLHSGRGGGVSDMFGGGASAVAAGSGVAEKNLDRITIVFVVIFTFTTMALAIRLQG